MAVVQRPVVSSIVLGIAGASHSEVRVQDAPLSGHWCLRAIRNQVVEPPPVEPHLSLLVDLDLEARALINKDVAVAPKCPRALVSDDLQLHHIELPVHGFHDQAGVRNHANLEGHISQWPLPPVDVLDDGVVDLWH